MAECSLRCKPRSTNKARCVFCFIILKIWPAALHRVLWGTRAAVRGEIASRTHGLATDPCSFLPWFLLLRLNTLEKDDVLLLFSLRTPRPRKTKCFRFSILHISVLSWINWPTYQAAASFHSAADLLLLLLKCKYTQKTALFNPSSTVRHNNPVHM